jgi:hypothetical protein
VRSITPHKWPLLLSFTHHLNAILHIGRGIIFIIYKAPHYSTFPANRAR